MIHYRGAVTAIGCWLLCPMLSATATPNEIERLAPSDSMIEVVRPTVLTSPVPTTVPENAQATVEPAVLKAQVSLQILADSGLDTAYLETVAAETKQLAGIPTVLLFRGLPMTMRRDGRKTADRVEAARRLEPFIHAGIPLSVDPSTFRALKEAVSTSDPSGQALTVPAVIVSAKGFLLDEERHEVVIGTASPEKALREVALRSPSDRMRRSVRRALDEKGHAARLDLKDVHDAERRPMRKGVPQ